MQKIYQYLYGRTDRLYHIRGLHRYLHLLRQAEQCDEEDTEATWLRTCDGGDTHYTTAPEAHPDKADCQEDHQEYKCEDLATKKGGFEQAQGVPKRGNPQYRQCDSAHRNPATFRVRNRFR